MKSIKQILTEADPLRHEPEISSQIRTQARQAIVAAAGAAPRAKRPSLRILRFATVTLVILGALVLGSRFWPRAGFESYAAVRFEIRLAEETPGPGLREVQVRESGRTIYLHEEVLVSNGDLEAAEVVSGRTPGEYAVAVRFSVEGTQKMRDATGNHIGKPLAILVDDRVVMAPVLRSAIGDSAEVTGNFTREQAEQIVNGLR